MEWIKLADTTPNSYTFRGTLLKFTAKYPFEEQVVMMVCEGFANPFRSGLITITGNQAGINMYTLFPEEATEHGLACKWLIENWNQWVDPNGDVNEVMICDGLDPDEMQRMLKNWVKLTEVGAEELFSRGTLLKFPAEYPFEDEVVMMLCQRPDTNNGLCLITITGHKAGKNCFQAFPVSEIDLTVSARWLMENWNNWVYLDCDFKDAFIHRPLEVSDFK